MTIDLQAELAALPPLTMPIQDDDPAVPTASTITQALTRLARQQFKAAQLTEHAHEQLRESLTQLREQSEDRRREIERQKLDAIDTRMRLIETLDALDDLTVMARQREEAFWIDRLRRFEQRCAEMLKALGVSELPGVGSVFDEYLHDVIETTTAADGVAPHTIVDQIKKGYRYDGRVIRRAQVITTK